MENFQIFPVNVIALVPAIQFENTIKNKLEYYKAMNRLEASLNKCPKIGGTDGMKEHPVIFHYFTSSTNIYICEYDKGDLMYGYAIIGDDLCNSEWGYFNRYLLLKTPDINIDYHFEEQTIEAALYKLYPDYFKKPQSLTI